MIIYASRVPSASSPPLPVRSGALSLPPEKTQTGTHRYYGSSFAEFRRIPGDVRKLACKNSFFRHPDGAENWYCNLRCCHAKRRKPDAGI